VTSSDQEAAKRSCKEDTTASSWPKRLFPLTTEMETSHGAETRTRHGNKATRRHGTTEPQGWTHIGPRPPRAFPWVYKESESAWVKGHQSNWTAPPTSRLPHSLNPNTSVLAARISNTLNKWAISSSPSGVTRR
jgi:hypothetical protein